MSNAAQAQAFPAEDKSVAPAVSQAGSVISVESADFKGTGPWDVQRLDDHRMLLVEREVASGVNASHGMASLPVEAFKDFLLGLSQTGWSGMVVVDTGAGLKRLYLNGGTVVFAASSLMDDRLGEVLYREARITLDELTGSAVMVTKTRKFGQVLLTNGIFTNAQLWAALKLQVKQIVRSIFMTDRIYCELSPGVGLAPTEVTFLESSEELLAECYSYGAAFRAFLSQLHSDSFVRLLVSPQKIQEKFPPGSFTGDLIALISAKSRIEELLGTSKLIDHYTIAALLNLVHSGLCALEPSHDGDRRTTALHGTRMAPLKARIDAFAYVLAAVRKAFHDAGQGFPVDEMHAFVQTLNPEGFPSIFLNAEGDLPRDCIGGLFNQCTANGARVDYFARRIEALIQFLLQLAGDSLDFQVAKRIRQDYRAVAG